MPNVNRITYADSKVYVDGIPLKGVSSCEINTTREVENIRSLLHYETTDRFLKSDQKPEVTISWILGDESTDPFFDFQTEGLLSTESFDIKKKDIIVIDYETATVGIQEMKSGFLTSYSVNASVGEPITAEAKYEGISYSTKTEFESLELFQTNHSYGTFLPSRIELSASFPEGDIFKFKIQSFQISVPIQRQSLKGLGEMSPNYRIPTLPAEATVSFSAIKTDITGIDFSKILLEKGNFLFNLKSCSVSDKQYGLSGCSLLGISESLDLEGNETIDFNYVSSITNDSFSFS